MTPETPTPTSGLRTTRAATPVTTRRTVVTFIGLFALVGAATGATQPPVVDLSPLTLGLIATSSVEQTLDNWKPFADAMAIKLKRPVLMVASKNYGDISDGVKDGRIQIAWVSSRVAVDLVESEKASVFAQMVKSDGSLGYKSMLLVPKASPMNTINDLVNRPGEYRFAAGGVKSMSGFLVPNYYVFRKYRIDPEKHFVSVTRGNHQENFLAVAEGRADIATSNTEDFPRFKAEMPDKFAAVRVLWQSTLIPNDPVLYRKDLSADTRQGIKKFFIGYGRTANEKLVMEKINGLSGFKTSGDFQLRPVVDLELFDSLTAAMREQITSPKAFAKSRERITARAARLDRLMSSTRLD